MGYNELVEATINTTYVDRSNLIVYETHFLHRIIHAVYVIIHDGSAHYNIQR